jgi:transcriptional regulator with XRE-family HTH domain
VPSALPEDVTKRLKRVLEDVVLPRFGGDPKRQQSAAARALRVTPSAINRVLNDKSSGSLDLVRRVSEFLNDNPSKILWGEDEPEVKKLREVPGFAEALAEARRRAAQEHPGLTVAELEQAADARIVPQPERVSAGLIIYMALSKAKAETLRPPRRKK